MIRKQLTQAQIARRARRSALSGRAAELGHGYPPAKVARATRKAAA